MPLPPKDRSLICNPEIGTRNSTLYDTPCVEILKLGQKAAVSTGSLLDSGDWRKPDSRCSIGRSATSAPQSTVMVCRAPVRGFQDLVRRVVELWYSDRSNPTLVDQRTKPNGLRSKWTRHLVPNCASRLWIQELSRQCRTAY